MSNRFLNKKNIDKERKRLKILKSLISQVIPIGKNFEKRIDKVWWKNEQQISK